MRHSRLVTTPANALIGTTFISTMLLATMLLAPSAMAGVPTTDLQPERLSRGADVAVPHIVDGFLVDGTRRIDLPGDVARLLGQSGSAWIVGTYGVGSSSDERVVRVEADGTLRTILTQVDPWAVDLSEDGKRLIAVPDPGKKRAAVRVWSARNGRRLAQRAFTGFPEVLTMRGQKALIRTRKEVLWWKVGKDVTLRLSTKEVFGADIEHDLLWFYTKAPYRGGCTKLVRLSDPTTKVWRSCRDRIAEVSPDGTQMATIDLLSDGIGPGVVTLREIDGTTLARWKSGWFGEIGWETPSTVLLGVNGKKVYATVRCTLDVCENATDPLPTRHPRQAG